MSQSAEPFVAHADRLLALRAEWQDILRRLDEMPTHWDERMRELRAQQAALVARRQWRSGPKTLLEAVGVAYRETRLTAGLAWLLRPDGHHGLGDTLLRHLLDAVGLEQASTAGVRTQLEESRDGGATRADLALYGHGWTVCLEAKVFALEGVNQLDRLRAAWANDPEPRFVLLTRRRSVLASAPMSHASWSHVTWADVAGWLRAAHRTADEPASGVLDYLRTLEHCHG